MADSVVPQVSDRIEDERVVLERVSFSRLLMDEEGARPRPTPRPFAGVLQVDGYGGFKRLAGERADQSIRLAFCWAHMRRDFFQFHASTKSPLAAEVLTRVAALYAIEAEIRGQPAEHRRRIRQERSRPIVEALHDWLLDHVDRVSGASDLAKAIRYAIRHWPGLIAFLDDGRIEMDSNTVERAIRPHTMRRSFCPSSSSDWKHWKFSLRIGATRVGLSPDDGGDAFPSQIGHFDLERCAGHDLFGGENLALDQAPDDVRSDAQFLAASRIVNHSPFFSAERRRMR